MCTSTCSIETFAEQTNTDDGSSKCDDVKQREVVAIWEIGKQ